MQREDRDEQAEYVEDTVLVCQELVDANKRDEAIDRLMTIYVGGAMRRRLEQGGAPYPATSEGLAHAIRERGFCETRHAVWGRCVLPDGHNPELGHSRDTPPQWALDKMWTHVSIIEAKARRAVEVNGAWTLAKGDRVQLVKKIAALAPVGSRGVITMVWEPSTANDVVLAAHFCVDCEGWPPFVTEASNLTLVERAST